jgi:peptide-methionine (S)-S-oxide reductase
MEAAMNKTITFGAGCFWCLDAAARRVPGITSSVVGYAGGTGDPPTYESLHHGGASDGWIEGVQLGFEPDVIGLTDVIDLFFQSHDPTTPNQDGANYGPEYHSTIFYNDQFQLDESRRAIELLQQRLSKPVVTTLRQFTTFVVAEEVHQDFYTKYTNAPYCRVIIAPKLRKLGLPE